MKERFEIVEIDIVEIQDDDVIATSGLANTWCPSETEMTDLFL